MLIVGLNAFISHSAALFSLIKLIAVKIILVNSGCYSWLEFL